MATSSVVSRSRRMGPGEGLTGREIDALKRLFDDRGSTEESDSQQSRRKDAEDLLNAYAKLGVNSRRTAFNAAVQLGIVTPWWANDD